MVFPLAADGGDGLEIRRVAANTLNKQPCIADKEWSSKKLVTGPKNPTDFLERLRKRKMVMRFGHGKLKVSIR
jgi:hypothetical protein